MVGQNPQNTESSPSRRIDELREHEEVNEELEFDIEKELKAIDSLSNQVTKRKVNEPKGFSKRAKLTAQATTSSTVFGPSIPFAGETSAAGDNDKEDYVLPSIFEEKDSFGPAVSEMLKSA